MSPFGDCFLDSLLSKTRGRRRRRMYVCYCLCRTFSYANFICAFTERRICFSFPLKKDEMAIMRVLKLISDATTTLFYLQFLMGFLRKSLLEWLFFKVEEEHHKVLSIFFLYAVSDIFFVKLPVP